MQSAVSRRVGHLDQQIEIREHRLTADEPEDHGGTDKGPRPTELLAASLASCTAITLLMYAERKEWDLADLQVSVDYKTPESGEPARLEVKIRTPAELTDEQRERLLVIASKCPVHRTLKANEVEVEDEWISG